ncbi:MAG: hypothetical protein A3E37_03755 [Candidatus Andersenbacteria bacterium RIFCSPHIGHO2_12_FULL_46_9]|nr:MAG: hypothetical protein UW94_C0005G0130 [Parcubacteria group bacterium GW2011_GWA2_45_14]OGY33248.1 MAG: hypothetical protein A3B76_00965 [Candidatus Andersenbacteria bacterium RIFCSPHIGHO2_02_FULL_46_16]OGY38263.1 MAG: hypothetical protein A3G57_04455 [Candidatus Andersenbacteria bacterium RIFCSPLOWO2_12_FULL_45_8]OGY38352.1 MAG: hypothetical protein A3E37_03755 [Candidatus Andersenbacteria bacterium RIFCSPHIGHO2_12_FULL_46_9]OGY38421.1 MAG: hypothetical protein A3I08_02610 [Candidatus An
MANSHQVTDVPNGIKQVFGARTGHYLTDEPGRLEFVPVWAVNEGKIICDAAFTWKQPVRGFASKDSYFGLTVSPDATFFVYFNDATYFVLCSKTANTDHLIMRIKTELRAANEH